MPFTDLPGGDYNVTGTAAAAAAAAIVNVAIAKLLLLMCGFHDGDYHHDHDHCHHHDDADEHDLILVTFPADVTYTDPHICQKQVTCHPPFAFTST